MLTPKAKRWQVLSKKKDLKEEEILKTLLINRGLKTKKEIDNFFNPPNPYQFTAKDLDINQKEVVKALKRIKKAIKDKEKIIIYGDFDTDGVCATAIMWETIYALGGKVLPFIPKREEGYGLKVKRIDEFVKQGVSLIITVDQGIVATKQAEHAGKVGVDLLITDHHTLGVKKPKANALVHTTKLSGSGVSWFLATKITKELKSKKALPGLDLVTIATITDMVPLLGANRSLVKHGLKKLKDTKRVGLLELFKVAGLDRQSIGAYAVGFIIGPRINASGRLDDPMVALRLLCTPNPRQAAHLASQINEQNKARQDLTEKTYLFAKEKWLSDGGEDALIFLYHESFEEGVVGLVANRLAEEFYRPAVVVSLKKGLAKASARSTDQFNIIEAIRACADILGPHGGHPKAAGFNVKKEHLEELSLRLKKIAREKLKTEDSSPTIEVDLELSFSSLNFALYDELSRLTPFGVDNPEPTFLTRGLTIEGANTVGIDGQHLKLTVFDEQLRKGFRAIAYGLGGRFSELTPDKKIDLVYTLSESKWNRQKNLELKIKDFRFKNGEGN